MSSLRPDLLVVVLLTISPPNLHIMVPLCKLLNAAVRILRESGKHHAGRAAQGDNCLVSHRVKVQ